jgi:hypothetical protein
MSKEAVFTMKKEPELCIEFMAEAQKLHIDLRRRCCAGSRNVNAKRVSMTSS